MNFDNKINDILGLNKKKSKKQSTQFSNLSMSGVFGKNPISDLLGKVTDKPTKKLLGASPKMQTKWFNMNSNQRNVARKKYKDTDGDRIPNRFDCSPKNVMKQDDINKYVLSDAEANVPPKPSLFKKRTTFPKKYPRDMIKALMFIENNNIVIRSSNSFLGTDKHGKEIGAWVKKYHYVPHKRKAGYVVQLNGRALKDEKILNYFYNNSDKVIYVNQPSIAKVLGHVNDPTYNQIIPEPMFLFQYDIIDLKNLPSKNLATLQDLEYGKTHY